MAKYIKPHPFATALIGVVACLLLLQGVRWTKGLLKEKVPTTLNDARVAERKAALAEIRAKTGEELANPGVVDATRGVLRLPISRAMELTVEQYQDPAKARAELKARVAKATASLESLLE